MISLEQIRQLDIRVKKAVSAVKSLSAENSALKQQIAGLEAQLIELNKEASERKADEVQLEVSLQSVLDVLDEVDKETSEIEPEPPEDNYVIETVPESEEPEINFSPNNSGDEVTLVDEPQVDEPQADEPEEVSQDAEPLNEPEENESESSEPATEEVIEAQPEEPETINLESDEEGDKFQSEFDIF